MELQFLPFKKCLIEPLEIFGRIIKILFVLSELNELCELCLMLNELCLMLRFIVFIGNGMDWKFGIKLIIVF